LGGVFEGGEELVDLGLDGVEPVIEMVYRVGGRGTFGASFDAL
jgi:hypothetical protein